MSLPLAQPASPSLTLEQYRQLKARALMLALAGQCRTPVDALRFLFDQLNTREHRVAEAALRSRLR
jgi:hypothetical protein